MAEDGGVDGVDSGEGRRVGEDAVQVGDGIVVGWRALAGPLLETERTAVQWICGIFR